MKPLRILMLSALIAGVVTGPVFAQLAVIDPANLVQNTLTALRELQQVNNEIQQLANEAVMLTNEAKNLTAINYNVVPRLLAILETTNQLLNQAQGLSLNLVQTEAHFALQYPTMYHVERFIEIAGAYDISGLKRFVRDMSKEWESGQDERVEGRVDSEGAIELITMHSAKGLEWPVVILVNAVGRVVLRSEFVHRADDDTIHWVLRDVEPPDLASALAEDGRLSDSERQRVWYVACSRAKELLIIPQVPGRSYKAWSAVIADVYDGIPELSVADLEITAPDALRNGRTRRPPNYLLKNAKKL